MNRRDSLKLIGTTAAIGCAPSVAAAVAADTHDAPSESALLRLNDELQKRLRRLQDMAVSKDPILKALGENGRLQTCSADDLGQGLVWSIRYRDVPPANLDGSITFYRMDLFKEARLPFRGMVARERFAWDSDTESLADKITDRLSSVVAEGLGWQFFNNGNENIGLHGTESFFGALSPAPRSGIPLARGALYPKDSYAGISTELGYYGGSCGSGWPQVICDRQFDFFTPLIVKPAFSGAGPLASILDGCHGCSKWRDTDTGIVVVGDTVDLRPTSNPCHIVHRSLPEGAVAYGVNISKTAFLSAQETLVSIDGVAWNYETRSVEVVGSVLGNFKFESPRYFFKVLA